MKITFTYETQVEVVVDTTTRQVESISCIRQLGSPLSGVRGYTSVSHQASEVETFTREALSAALNTIRTGRHPRWKWKEPV